MAKPRGTGILPSRDELLEFIRGQRTPLGKREIAREYRLQATDRPALSEMLDALEENGDIHRARNRRYSAGRKIPSVCVLEVTGLDRDGEPVLAIAGRDAGAASPRIHLARGKQRGRAPGIGDRVLARMDRKSENYYVAHIMRRLESRPASIFGIFRKSPSGGQIEPASRKLKTHFHVDTDDVGSAEDGEFVTADVLPGRQFGMPTASITGRIGAADDPGAITQLCIAENDIPVDFSQEAQAEADDAEAAPMGARTDLRELPLITIDDATARDFDDAVWAEPDPDPDNKGGWHLIVAIADVAWYVRPGNALDRAAETRGNSVYLPGTVIPMLPEALSNGLCSLLPDQDRACLCVEMIINADGVKQSHRFFRAIIHSHARLTYHQVQHVIDGVLNEADLSVPAGTIYNLLGAYHCLRSARQERGALELNIAEAKILFDAANKPVAVESRFQQEANQLIEEFMILANISAAETLEQARKICMYRVHDRPDPQKLDTLYELTESMGIAFAKGQVVSPLVLNQLLARVKDSPAEMAINEAVLRCQARAVYDTSNIGHYGLGLSRYAHFTSPIRRYADLLVHRAIISQLESTTQNLLADQATDIAIHISQTEQRAAKAERRTVARFSALLSHKLEGSQAQVVITGIVGAGLFVRLEDGITEGFIHRKTLPDDYYDIADAGMSLIGKELGWHFTVGMQIEASILKVDIASGGVTLRWFAGGEQKLPELPARRRRKHQYPKKPHARPKRRR